MKPMLIRTGLAVAAPLVAALALAGVASASHLEAELTPSDAAEVGQPSEVQAALHFADDGSPAAEVPVTFYMTASFAEVEGEIVLGEAVTDAGGVATLEYEPRTAGDHEIRMEYAAGEGGEPESVTSTISVAGGSQQLHQSTAGVDIPGLNVWLLIAVVGGVWAILLSVALRVIAIAHNGSEAGPGAEGGLPGAR